MTLWWLSALGAAGVGALAAWGGTARLHRETAALRRSLHRLQTTDLRAPGPDRTDR